MTFPTTIGEQINQAFAQIFTVDKVVFCITATVKAILIFIAAKLVIRFGKSMINRVTTRENQNYFDPNRALTLGSLLKSVLTYTVYFMALLSILEAYNIKYTGVLAGAGIVGLAVGFGAQNFVKDIITGFFIIFENQFGVGDYVNVAGVSGTVEEVGLRSTRIRDFGGQLHMIPNGQISQVTNFNRGSMRALVDVALHYQADLGEAVAVLEEVCAEVNQLLAEVISEPAQVLGVQSFDGPEVIIRIIAKCKPMEQWRVERELRWRIKEALQKRGIHTPYARPVYLPMADGGPAEEGADEDGKL